MRQASSNGKRSGSIYECFILKKKIDNADSQSKFIRKAHFVIFNLVLFLKYIVVHLYVKGKKNPILLEVIAIQNQQKLKPLAFLVFPHCVNYRMTGCSRSNFELNMFFRPGETRIPKDNPSPGKRNKN